MFGETTMSSEAQTKLLDHLKTLGGEIPAEFAHLVKDSDRRRWEGKKRVEDFFMAESGEVYEAPAAYRDSKDLNTLLQYVARNGANDLYLGDGSPIELRVHGRLYKLTDRSLTADEVRQLMVALYGDSTSVITSVLNGERKDCSYQCPGETMEDFSRWRVFMSLRSVTGGLGFRVVCRQIAVDPPTCAQVFMPPDIIQSVESLHRGIFLMTGPTGSGKSTSLAALLRHRLESPDFSDHLITAEWPIEYVYERIRKPFSVVTQWEVPRMMVSFRDAVVAALRADPDLFLLGEMRDRPTMEAGLQVALTGHGMLSTMHTNSVVQTITRILKEFKEGEREAIQYDLVDNLHMIVSQMLRKTPDGKRVALRERLAIDGSSKERLRTAKNLAQALRKEIESSGRLLVEEARDLYKEGRLAKEELDNIEHMDKMERGGVL
ncbi:type IV pilus twitching motility protein PilT [Geopseudomonas aromaticivorans]